MTSGYANVHDTTVREAFDRYQSGQRVDISGDWLGYDPDAPTADAEWVKHNLDRVASLPNGYCGRPAQQECPHPNACLTCPDFQTTVEFLEVHRRQAATNRRLIAQADAKGQSDWPRTSARSRPTWSALSLRSKRSTMTARQMATDNLARANARRHESAIAAAHVAIEEFCREGREINFGAVSRAAGVSRAWLYRQADLRDSIGRLRSSAPLARPDAAAQRASTSRSANAWKALKRR